MSILDKKTTAKLYIIDSQASEENNYQQIDPETDSKVVFGEKTVVDDDGNVVTKTITMQEHIDDETIHFTRESLINSKLGTFVKTSNMKAGDDIKIEIDEETNDVTISVDDHPTKDLLTQDNIKALDESIIVQKDSESNDVYLKAVIPHIEDISKLVQKNNIKAGDESVNITYSETNNDVFITARGQVYTAGDGIGISDDNVISNTNPDKEVVLTGGKNVKVEGTYPNFVISASSGATVADWTPNTDFYEGQFVVYQNSIFRCKANHTSGTIFEPEYWDLIAGYSISKYYYLDEDNDITSIVLDKMIPNKGVLTINVGGIILQAQNYDLGSDGKTISFLKALPKGEIVEVSVAGNEIINQFDNGVKIEVWKANNSYAVDNVVVYNNILYKCKENHISGTEFDDTKWEVLAGYYKDVINTTKSGAETITLPYEVNDKNMIIVNVNGKVLQNDEFEINGLVLSFVEALADNSKIELQLLNNAVIQQLNLPSTRDHSEEYLRVNANGSLYELLTKSEVLSDLKLSSVVDIENHKNNYLKVKSDESDVEYVSTDKMTSDLGLKTLADGLKISFDGKNITVSEGSILSSDGDVLLRLSEPLTRDVNNGFMLRDKEEDYYGTAAEYTGETYTFPVKTSATEPFDTIRAESEYTDNEAWRAMDKYDQTSTDANGWRTLSGVTASEWYYIRDYGESLCIQSVDIYGTTSEGNNRPKDCQIFVGDSSNVKASFTLANVNMAHIHIDLAEPEWNNVFGIKILNSYGTSVGLKHVVLQGLYPTYISKNHNYNVFLICKEDGSDVNILTSTKSESLSLPDGYTHYAKIGSFSVDSDTNIYNVYPDEEVKETSVNGEGYLGDNVLYTWVRNSNDFATKVVEQWGEATPSNGFIAFNESYKNSCFYVNVSSGSVLSISKDGFTVSSTSKVYWNSKGY